MKTYIKKLSVLAAIALLVSGCNEKDFLNKVNPNSPVEQTFWTTEANAVSAMPTIYSSIVVRCMVTTVHIQDGIQ